MADRKKNANRHAKKDVIVIDDDDFPQPPVKNLKIEEEPVLSPEFVELQQKVHKLEDKVKRAFRIAGEYQKRAEVAETRLDSKFEIKDGVVVFTEKIRADELEIRLAEVSARWEEERGRADNVVALNADLTGQIESLKREMAEMGRKLQTGTEDRVRDSLYEMGEEGQMELDEPQMIAVVKKERRTPRRSSIPKDLWTFPEWMREVKRKRFPYVPQIGDHVVYFREGHELYLNAVEETKLYNVDARMRPKSDSGMEEFAVIKDIKFILKPYRLIKLTLAKTDSEGRKTGRSWTVNYHKMDNAPDFIILRAFYEEGLAMALKVGDEIESAIDGKWRSGIVETMNNNKTYPNAHWQSVGVRWESGDEDALSVWDLKKNTTGRVSGEPVSEEEEISMGSVPNCEGDWPVGDENGEKIRKRIKSAILELAECGTIQVYGTPIDLGLYPDYPTKVAYPMDLQTICERMDNQYYRRLRSILHDIHYIAISAEAYNLENAPIVTHANLFVRVVTKIVNDPSIEKFTTFLESFYDDGDRDLIEFKRRPLPEVKTELLESSRDGSNSEGNEMDGLYSLPRWATDAIEVLEKLMKLPCANHFSIKDQNNKVLAKVWEKCDDLSTLLEKVRGGEMKSPLELENAVHSIVSTGLEVIGQMHWNREHGIMCQMIYADLRALRTHFNNRYKATIATSESSLASVQSKRGVSVLRNLQKRTRDQHQHANNTRRSGVAAESDDDQPSTSKRRRDH